jgi:phage terminase small subunit
VSKGRVPKPGDDRVGHRAGVGEGTQLEVAPVEPELVSARPPKDLSPLAAEVWQICVTDMAELGHLRQPDLLQLRNYAVEVAIAVECEAAITEFGAVMKEPILAWSSEAEAMEVVGWRLKKNPACQLHREASNAVRLMAADLALTPIARIRGNLMSAVTASVAMNIKNELERDVVDAEKAERAATRRRRAAAKQTETPTARRRAAAPKTEGPAARRKPKKQK